MLQRRLDCFLVLMALAAAILHCVLYALLCSWSQDAIVSCSGVKYSMRPSGQPHALATFTSSLRLLSHSGGPPALQGRPLWG